ncbi:MAG: sulfatase-like hydrolase/transferase [Calditrichaeota bacterium]|nr:sulfatase-like hydrolase/transferase [Calditrichota bacterium]
MIHKNRREFLKTISAGAAGVSLLPVTQMLSCTKGQVLPNIVLIFIDDQGYADLGSYGATEFETPNIDRLAEQGIRFTSFYVSQAVCSASRASLLSGCYSGRVGIQGALGPYAQHGINADEELLPELLKKRGYSTSIIGKWHLGHEKQFLPLQHGFDEYFGLPYSNDMWPVDYDGTPNADPRKAKYPPLPLIKDNETLDIIETLEDQSRLTKRYTEKALDFIQRNKANPFFLYLAHSMVHVPIAADPDFVGTSKQGLFGDVMQEVDWSVGQVLQTLKELNLEENTLVIYTSDNGPWLNFGNHAGSAKPLREGKGTAFEGGVRVPCIMRWPGIIPENVVTDKMASTIDILPTLCAVTSAALPEKKIDGVNILSLMKNEKNARPRDEFYYYYGKELRAIRKGPWKLYFPHSSRSYEGVEAGRDGYPGPYNRIALQNELYNLETDISETRNVAADHPEIVSEIEKIADRVRADLGDSLTGVEGQGNREVGRIYQAHKNVTHLAVGAKVQLEKMYSRKYSAGGESGLVDGRRGTTDFTDGLWQGFEKDDIIAILDLGKVMDIKKLRAGFLQSQDAWIFLPHNVLFFVSKDGTDYQRVGAHSSNESNYSAGAKVVDAQADFNPVAARYIKVHAENRQYCPEWHHGAGGKAWIFCDEIIAE